MAVKLYDLYKDKTRPVNTRKAQTAETPGWAQDTYDKYTSYIRAGTAQTMKQMASAAPDTIKQTAANFMNSLRSGAADGAQTARPDTAVSGGGGTSPYAAQLNSLYEQIINRKPFRFDLANDPLYRQAADQNTLLGRQAMTDTMGRAAAMTGGYGNSYAQAVGNQAYQQYLAQLNAMTPEVWDRQYQAYLDQGDRLLQDYQLAQAHAAASGRSTGAAQAIAEPTEDATEQTAGTDWDSWIVRWLAGEAVANAQAGLQGAVQNYQLTRDPFTTYYQMLKKEQEKDK